MKRSAHALVDDADWCGHVQVSLRTWTCADCDRPVTAETRKRLESAPTKAPPGSVWVLLSGKREEAQDGYVRGSVTGIFSDRALIARRLIQYRYCDADEIRDAMRRTHWYQGAFNEDIFEGWEEEADECGAVHAHDLRLERIDMLDGRWAYRSGSRV